MADDVLFVPEECGPLGDLIFEKLKAGDGNDTLAGDFKGDYLIGADFLDGVSADTKWQDFDLSQMSWGNESRALIDKATRGAITLPGECGPLADLILEKLKTGDGGERIGNDFKSDYTEGATYLQDVPDDTRFKDFDLSGFQWNADAKAVIETAQKS